MLLPLPPPQEFASLLPASPTLPSPAGVLSLKSLCAVQVPGGADGRLKHRSLALNLPLPVVGWGSGSFIFTENSRVLGTVLGTGSKITIFEHLPRARRCDQHSTEVASVQELNAYKTLRQPPGAHHYSRVPAAAISCPCHNHRRGGQSCISMQKHKLRGALACCHVGLKPGALRG